MDREEGPVGPCRRESVNFVLILQCKWKDGKPFSKKLLTFEGLGVGLLWPLTVNSTYRRLAFLFHRRTRKKSFQIILRPDVIIALRVFSRAERQNAAKHIKRVTPTTTRATVLSV